MSDRGAITACRLLPGDGFVKAIAGYLNSPRAPRPAYYVTVTNMGRLPALAWSADDRPSSHRFATARRAWRPTLDWSTPKCRRRIPIQFSAPVDSCADKIPYVRLWLRRHFARLTVRIFTLRPGQLTIAVDPDAGTISIDAPAELSWYLIPASILHEHSVIRSRAAAEVPQGIADPYRIDDISPLTPDRLRMILGQNIIQVPVDADTKK